MSEDFVKNKLFMKFEQESEGLTDITKALV